MPWRQVSGFFVQSFTLSKDLGEATELMTMTSMVQMAFRGAINVFKI